MIKLKIINIVIHILHIDLYHIIYTNIVNNYINFNIIRKIYIDLVIFTYMNQNNRCESFENETCNCGFCCIDG